MGCLNTKGKNDVEPVNKVTVEPAPPSHAGLYWLQEVGTDGQKGVWALVNATQPGDEPPPLPPLPGTETKKEDPELLVADIDSSEQPTRVPPEGDGTHPLGANGAPQAVP